MLFSSLIVLSLGALSFAMPSQLTARAPSAADQKAYLTAHNTVRASHGAAALVWNQTLSDAGAKWAKKCVFQHSGGSLGPFGENLYAATGSTSPAAAVKAWTDEAKNYNPSSPVPSHFTQVVWKNTKQVGCAEVNCAPGTIFDSKFGTSSFYICEYFPAGNVIGQFPKNVQK